MKFDLKATMYDIFGYLFPGIIFLYWILYELETRFSINLKNIDMKIFSETQDEKIMFFIMAYFAGHFISTIAEIILETIVYDIFIRKIEILTFKVKLSDKIIKKIEEKYEREFESKFNIRKNLRYLIVYVEENYQNIYSTAFVFLTFLGLGRNMALILFFIIIFSKIAFILKLGIGFIMIVFLLQFILFKIYFESHVLCSYILQDNKKFKEE